VQYEFRLPDLGEGVAEGEITEWLIEVGQQVNEDQPMVEVETDKATVEIPCPVDGVVLGLHAATGERVTVGNLLVTIETADLATSSTVVPEASPAAERQEPVADLGVAGHLLAVNAAVHLPVVAAPADVEQPKAGTAALLAERLHLGTRGVEKLAPRREGGEPARRSGAVLHRVCRAEAPGGIPGASRFSRSGRAAVYTDAPAGATFGPRHHGALVQDACADTDVDKVVNACDAGREGELIFAYVYEAAGADKPVQRLWLQSMTKGAIQEAFGHLIPAEEKHSLEQAARSRSEADWIVAGSVLRRRMRAN